MQKLLGVRDDFPILSGNLVYLDNAATSQKPACVTDRLMRYYQEENANVYRGGYRLSRQSTDSYRIARKSMENFLEAESGGSVIFVRGATEACNLAAAGFCRRYLRPGDNIVVTELEHHSNLLPWLEQCRMRQCSLRIARAQEDGGLPACRVTELIDERTRLVAVTAMSNVTGVCPDLPAIIEAAHRRKAAVFVDAAQAAAHTELPAKELDYDFLCFSGHKVYGPMGSGVLYGKRKFLDEMEPVFFGGGMVEEAGTENVLYKSVPEKFEAGTPDVAASLGLETAVQYLGKLGRKEVRAYENQLAGYLRESLEKLNGIRILGPEGLTGPVLSFVSDRLSSYDIGMMLAMKNIAVRSGAHCAHPYMRRLDVRGACRVSLALYNTRQDIDFLCAGLKEILHDTGKS